MEKCPCGSQKPYLECCEPIVTWKTNSSIPEQLMRARYSAYAKEKIDFILNTTIEDKRKECDEQAIRNWSVKSIWQKLEILSTKDGAPQDNEGIVEFIAHYTEGGICKNLHEKALFKKVDGKWYYVDGEIQKPKPFIRSEDKISRNSPCPCGSGRKYKKCCASDASA